MGRESSNSLLRAGLHFRSYLRGLFSLHLDTDEAGTIENIQKGIEFRGGNLWALIFSVLIASIGLNMNSAAVIIGAMLISPLMGPIVGVGLALGTYDFPTLRTSLRNLVITVVFAVFASYLYFLASPLKEAGSELIARTQPTTYDVLIAICGGLTGIVAGSRKDRGTAIPGVAIATALMPPLCTAGYGLATLNMPFFWGAIYLFFINSFFIALSTTVIVRYLKFPRIHYVDPKKEKRAKLIISIVVFLAIVPSAITAWSIVQENFFIKKANRFIAENFQMEKSALLHTRLIHSLRGGQITVSLFGEALSPEEIIAIKARLPEYDLEGVNLIVQQRGQGLEKVESDKIRMEFLQLNHDLNAEELATRDRRIQELELQLQKRTEETQQQKELPMEMAVLFPGIRSIAVSQSVRFSADTSVAPDTLHTALLGWKGTRPKAAALDKLQQYLQVRLKVQKINLIFE